jgi:hypothetical protein
MLQRLAIFNHFPIKFRGAKREKSFSGGSLLGERAGVRGNWAQVVSTGSGVLSLGGEREVQVFAGISIVRLESQGFLELADRLRVAALLVEEGA